MHPKVAIITINWNQAEDTIKCLKSLQAIDYPNYNVIVVDNGSIDGSPEIIKESFPDIVMIKNPKNFGFCEGNNVGIEYALKHGAEYIYLLNNDTVVHPRILTELVEVVESDPVIGMAGSKIYFMDRPKTISFAGGKINWLLGKGYYIGDGKEDVGQFNKIREVDTISGCSLLIKKEVIERIGTMDPIYFRYWEETDWCVRVKRAGYKLIYVPTSILWHKYAASTEGPSPITEYYDTRNGLYFFLYWAPGYWKIISLFSFFVRRGIRVIKLIVKFFLGDRRALRKIDGLFLGLFDFFMKRIGECPYSRLI